MSFLRLYVGALTASRASILRLSNDVFKAPLFRVKRSVIILLSVIVTRLTGAREGFERFRFVRGFHVGVFVGGQDLVATSVEERVEGVFVVRRGENLEHREESVGARAESRGWVERFAIDPSSCHCGGI